MTRIRKNLGGTFGFWQLVPKVTVNNVKPCVSSSEEGGVVALLECYNRAFRALVGFFEFKYCGDMWA